MVNAAAHGKCAEYSRHSSWIPAERRQETALRNPFCRIQLQKSGRRAAHGAKRQDYCARKLKVLFQRWRRGLNNAVISPFAGSNAAMPLPFHALQARQSCLSRQYSHRSPARLATNRRNWLSISGTRRVFAPRFRLGHDHQMFELKEIGEFLLFLLGQPAFAISRCEICHTFLGSLRRMERQQSSRINLRREEVDYLKVCRCARTHQIPYSS